MGNGLVKKIVLPLTIGIFSLVGCNNNSGENNSNEKQKYFFLVNEKSYYDESDNRFELEVSRGVRKANFVFDGVDKCKYCNDIARMAWIKSSDKIGKLHYLIKKGNYI